MVVIGVIAILAALLLPALAGAKSRAWRIVCLNNKRQLYLGWHLYADDNHGLLMPSIGPLEVGGFRGLWTYGGPETRSAFGGGWSTNQLNTNIAMLLRGSMGFYVKTPESYRCPADRYLSEVQRALGWKERVRSTSMNTWVGGFKDGYFGTVGPHNSLWGRSKYMVYGRDTDFLHSSPADVWVFIDEHPDSIGSPAFVMLPPDVTIPSGTWDTLPASYHDGAGVLGYADGHAEAHWWVAASTRRPVYAGTKPVVWPWWPFAGDYRDVWWLWARTTETVP